MDILEILELSNRFKISKEDDTFDIEHLTYDIGANISKSGIIKYYVTGCYNSGIDWLEVDMDGLMELKKLCELVVKKEGI